MAFALAFGRAHPILRVILLAVLICLLVLPAPATAILWGACAPARALALVALFCIPSAAAIPAGLRQAALSAGATPLRAWRDVVFAEIWLPAALGAFAAWLRG